MKKRILACLLTLSLTVMLITATGITLSVGAATGKLATALNDTANWWLDGDLAPAGISGISSDGVMTIEKNNTGAVTYQGNFVQSGVTMSFDIRYSGDARPNWTALQFRPNTVGNYAASYSVWISNEWVSLAIIPTHFSDGTACAYTNLMDGNLHTLDITITDVAEGVQLTMVVDGGTPITAVDTNNTFGPEYTGFGVYHHCDVATASDFSFSIADLGVLPRNWKTSLTEALNDSASWAAYAGNNSASMNNNSITYATNEGYNHNVLNYKGDFVQSGRTMSFDLKLTTATWTTLQFRSDQGSAQGWASSETRTSYTVIFRGDGYVGVGLGCTFFNDIVNPAPGSYIYVPTALADGAVHTLDVTITDVAEGVKIECVFDGQTFGWTDTAKTFGPGRTGFGVHQVGTGTFVLAEKGVLSGNVSVTAPEVEGVQIRNDNTSMRFVLSANEAEFTALRNAGYTVEYGTILVEKDKFGEDNLTVTDYSTGFGGATPTTIACSSAYRPDGWEGSLVWALALTNINDAAKQGTDIAVRAYVKVSKGGNTWYYYSNDTTTDYGAYAVSFSTVKNTYGGTNSKAKERR